VESWLSRRYVITDACPNQSVDRLYNLAASQRLASSLLTLFLWRVQNNTRVFFPVKVAFGTR